MHERILSSPRRQRKQLQIEANDLEQEIRMATPPRGRPVSSPRGRPVSSPTPPVSSPSHQDAAAEARQARVTSRIAQLEHELGENREQNQPTAAVASSNMPASSSALATNAMPAELQYVSKSERRQRAAALKRAEEAPANYAEEAPANLSRSNSMAAPSTPRLGGEYSQLHPRYSCE